MNGNLTHVFVGAVIKTVVLHVGPIKSDEVIKKSFITNCTVFTLCILYGCALCTMQIRAVCFRFCCNNLINYLLISYLLCLTFRACGNELCWDVLNDVVHSVPYFLNVEIISI